MKKEIKSIGIKETKIYDNSSGVVGIVLGILSVLSGVPGILLGFVGFWFSFYQCKKKNNKWATWGMVLNVIGFILGVVFAYYVYLGFSSLSGLQGVPA